MDSPYVTERSLGLLHGDLRKLRVLEERLEDFCALIRAEAVDESDEHAATRRYVELLADAKLLDLLVPGEHGGLNPEVSATQVCLARQWLARESGALDTAFVMQGLGSFPLVLAGAATLAKEILPRVRAGATICGFAITEPDAGSDVSNMKTTARVVGDEIQLDGMKWFISNAGVAHGYSVFAREIEKDHDDGDATYSAFWVPADTPGLRVVPQKVIAPHPIGEVHFDGVRVPITSRIGERGQGLKLALGNLDQFRPTVGAAALGLADRALTCTVEHLHARVQFGKPLAKQQGLRFALADLVTAHTAAQLLVYRAAGAKDRGEATSQQVAMGKLFATETAQQVIDRAVQSLGGRGVTVGEIPERLYREVRALRIYEGTSEIQKLVIARELFRASS